MMSLQNITNIYLNILEDDSSSSHIEIINELLSMTSFFIRVLFEELSESFECNVISIEESSHGHVDVGRIELKVDLFVDCSLTIHMEVLSSLRDCHFIQDK